MSATFILGLFAATLSTLAFLPQVIKTWRTRSADDVSSATFFTIAIGNAMWIIYAWLRTDWPLLGTNALIFVLAATILILKFRFRSSEIVHHTEPISVKEKIGSEQHVEERR